MNDSIQDEKEIIAIRLEKLHQWKQQGQAFPNDFKRDSFAQEIINRYQDEDLSERDIKVKIAGRIRLKRVMGKASFIHVQDMTGKIQLYVTRDLIGVEPYTDFKTWDIGDIVGAQGTLFVTKTGELSIKVTSIKMLTKSIQPLPDKHHGLANTEMKYRKRYLDLIVNPQAQDTFLIRSRVVGFIREYLSKQQFVEVETPMMHLIPGGAAARPFVTHHNSLDMDLYLRIAPELYLKRLVVGGLERVFEINRNFRNEGISTQHNPEFTMLEFYQAYSDYHELMDLTEDMLSKLAWHIHGKHDLEYQGVSIDFKGPFAKMTLEEAVLKYNPKLTKDDLQQKKNLAAYLQSMDASVDESWGTGKLALEIFEKTVEEKLIQPTFITEYPREVSPLARVNDHNPNITDRFEFFIAGFEVANAFSELNDPLDQAERFQEQVKAKDAGDHEAMCYDEDYIKALEHGLPPTAGEGIGIDRLVMILTNSASIRDVLLFPLLRSSQ